MFLARADTCIQGEGRHNIFVRLEIANQLRGEGGEKGREGRKEYELARKHTRLASRSSRLQGTTTGELISCLKLLVELQSGNVEGKDRLDSRDGDWTLTLN